MSELNRDEMRNLFHDGLGLDGLSPEDPIRVVVDPFIESAVAGMASDDPTDRARAYRLVQDILAFSADEKLPNFGQSLVSPEEVQTGLLQIQAGMRDENFTPQEEPYATTLMSYGSRVAEEVKKQGQALRPDDIWGDTEVELLLGQMLEKGLIYDTPEQALALILSSRDKIYKQLGSNINSNENEEAKLDDDLP